MNFSARTRSIILLICIVLSTGITGGYTAFLTGSDPVGALIIGIGIAASNVVTALMKTPNDKAAEATRTTPPFKQ